MRFTIAYYFVLLYSTFIFQPLLLLVDDALSHTFDDAIHIATVHAKYGNNHLEIQLATAGTDNDNDNDKNHNTQKSEEQVPVHFSQDEYRYDFSPDNYSHTCNLFAWFKLPIIFISFQTPPPRSVRMV